MPRLGLLGWPVAHSRSPVMFIAAFRALSLEGWSYQRLPVPPELLAETTRALGAAGFVGANVTIPHKEAALALADRASESARAIGAANTLTLHPEGSIEAENTDAPGLLAALECSPEGLSVLVLGAGGSARAAAWALSQAGAREVSVWNRTHERAVSVAQELGVRAVRRAVDADLLVNCTSVGLERSASDSQTLNQLGLSADQVGRYPYVVDLVYQDGTTPLLTLAKERGARTTDGLQVLLAQGALSFELWTGRRAPLEAMRGALRIDEEGQ